MRAVRGSLYVARGDEIYNLEDTAASIWRLADGTRTIAEIGAAIAAEYDTDPETATADASAFVEQLRAAGFVEPRA